MNEPQFELSTHLKVMAAIGNVCLQWALLEQMVLGLIATIEGLPLDKVYLIFGSLDMKPRLDMAINLTRAAKVPTSIVNKVATVRSALKDERLSDKRNQAVHGVQKASSEPDSMQFTMPRWNGNRRTETVSAIDLAHLSVRLNALANDVRSLGEDVHAWKIRVLENRRKHAEREFAETHSSIILKIAKGFNASAKRIWRNLKR